MGGKGFGGIRATDILGVLRLRADGASLRMTQTAKTSRYHARYPPFRKRKGRPPGSLARCQGVVSWTEPVGVAVKVSV